MNTSFLKARQTQYAAYITLYLSIVIAILAVANVLSDRYNKSFDTTSNKRYSLSPQTAKIVKELKQPATITYYDQSVRMDQGQGKDLLEQYAELSPKLKIEYVDPDKNPQLATAAGVREYGTAIVKIGDRKEVAKSVNEEGITGAFIRLVKNSSRTVCFAAGNGEHQIDNTQRQGYSRFKDLLSRDGYESKSVDLLQKAEVPQDCRVLVIGGPHNEYPQPYVDAIAKYVEDGGRALFLLDPPFQLGRDEISENAALSKQLADWGVTLDQDLILDTNPIGQITGLGEGVALVRQYDSHPIVNEMKGSTTAFPFSRSLQTKSGSKTTVEKLFSSSGTSLATSKLNSPTIDINDPKNTKGPFPLAAAGTYNTGKENTEGRFIVVGSSEWVSNSFIPTLDNRDLAVNVINWLSSDEDLISIRPKERDDRRIAMTVAQIFWLRNISLFLIPLIVIAMGVSVWSGRR